MKNLEEITLKKVAEMFATAKEHLKEDYVVMVGGEDIEDEQDLQDVFTQFVMLDIFEEADRIIAEHKREKYKAHLKEDIRKDFKKLIEEVKKVSKENPEDEFLKEILDCAKKGEF